MSSATSRGAVIGIEHALAIIELADKFNKDLAWVSQQLAEFKESIEDTDNE